MTKLMTKLTNAQAQFLKEGHLAVVATRRPDGSIQQTPTWVDSDGEHVLVNTAEGRWKPKYLRKDPHVSVTVVDETNPYRWLSVSGAAELDHAGAEEHIDVLAHRYTGQDYGGASDEQRVIVRITPERITSRGIED